MSYWRNNGILILFVGLPFFFAACRDKQPRVSEEQCRATQEKMADVNRILVSKDKRRIEGYIYRQQMEMQESPTGLWYSVNNPDSDDSVKQGMNVSIRYTLSLLEGDVCYDSEKDGIKSFRVGQGGVESGLEEGILMMKVGGKATFIMPPHLAHGLPGDGDYIPARAIIKYDIEVISAE